MLVDEATELLRRVGRYTKDDRVCRLVVGGVIADAAGLCRTARRVGLGIEVENHVAPAEIGEPDSEESNGKAMAILSTMVGALTLSRVVNAPDLAQAFLDAAVEQVREAVADRKDDRRRLGALSRSGKRRSQSSAAQE